ITVLVLYVLLNLRKEIIIDSKNLMITRKNYFGKRLLNVGYKINYKENLILNCLSFNKIGDDHTISSYRYEIFLTFKNSKFILFSTTDASILNVLHRFFNDNEIIYNGSKVVFVFRGEKKGNPFE